MKFFSLVTLAAFLLSGCMKKNTTSDTETPVSVVGHLRYYCNCLDGPGLYYVAEDTLAEKSASVSVSADSIMLIGDGKGSWLADINSDLESYLDKRTVLKGTLTSLKGCLQSMVAGPCNPTIPVINHSSLTIIPE